MDSRPTSFDQMVLTDVTRKLLSGVSSIDKVTSLLFHGGPGVGKTSAIDCLCAALERSSPLFNRRRDVLALNASDDRGLDTVRSLVVSFISHSSTGLKLVVLDEIDAMTLPAQRTLATVMIKHRAVLLATCNYLCRVDAALRDMCILVQMPAPERTEAVERLASITGVPLELANDVYTQTSGDLRTAKNYCGLLPSFATAPNFLTPEQRLDNAIVGVCRDHARALIGRSDLRTELETLLTAIRVPVAHREKALSELRAELGAN
jgi:DNA polymerase III delta prime subunit